MTPEKLKQFGITIEEVASALEKSNSNSTGGFVDAQSQEYLVRNLARFYSVDELKNTVVAYRNNTAIKVGDVSDVEFGAKIKRGDAGSNGKPAVIMSIQKQPGASTLELTEKIDTALAELQENLPEDIEVNANLFQQANFIDTSISNVIEALRDGAILVVIVLFLFLLNFRTTFITLTAIPHQVLRENTQRRIVIQSNTAGRDLGSVVGDMRERIAAQVRLPEGYFLEYGGQFEAQQAATRTLSLLTIFSLIAIFFILLKALGDWRTALQVMINIPLALIGAIAALLLTGGVFSIATLVGFISLVGITSRNGIMMLSHYLHLIREEGEILPKK